MSFINYMAREINCKIVYYGPGLCGKTTNLQYIYERTNPDAKGKMISLATETDRTLFFDFLPLALGEIRGFKTRFHLYTVPGQVFYDASRKLILKGVDGVVFVADSQIGRIEANQESVENLRTNLAEQGYSLDKIPYVIQYNKRDLPEIADIPELRSLLNPTNVPDFEGVARTGVGVFDTLKAVAKLVLTELKKGGPSRYGPSNAERPPVQDQRPFSLLSPARSSGPLVNPVPPRAVLRLHPGAEALGLLAVGLPRAFGEHQKHERVDRRSTTGVSDD